MNPGMDPMANLSTPNPNGQDPAGTGTGGEGNDVYDLKALMVNASQSDKIHSYMGIVSGCVAGVLGLLNWQGIGFFFFTHFLVSISILARMNFVLKTFTRKSMVVFLCEGLQTCFMSYMLFWTLFYGLVYLF